MVNYREILRLHSLNHSQREIARASGNSRNTVSEVLRAAAEQKVTWPLDDDITDSTWRISSFRTGEKTKACMLSQITPTSTENLPETA